MQPGCGRGGGMHSVSSEEQPEVAFLSSINYINLDTKLSTFEYNIQDI